MKKWIVFIIVSLILISHHAIAENNNIIVRIGDQTITKKQFELVYQLINQQSGQAAPKQLVLDELVKTILLAQEAQRQQLHETPEVKQALMQQRNGLLASTLLLKLGKELQPSDKDMQEATKDLPTEEYQMGYILVADEMLAEQVIEQLNQKKPFADLAKQYSIDSSRDAGGQIDWTNDWLTSETLLPIIASLKTGQHTPTPIKGQQGWQILQVKARRPITPAALEALQQQVKAQLIDERINHYVENLKSNADVVYSK